MPRLLGAVEHLTLMGGTDRGLIAPEGLLDFLDVGLDPAATRLQIGGVIHHQQGKLGAAHVGYVVEQVLDREHARQGGIGKIQHAIAHAAQFAGEKNTEYHVDGGNDRKDHGNLFADRQIFVKHGGW